MMDYINKLQEIIEYIKAKKALLYEMKDLTEKQADSISQEDVDKLTSLIKDKDGIIKKIIKVDDSFKSAYDSLKLELGVDSLDKADVLPKTLLIELKEQTGEILALIDNITRVDDQNKKNAQSLKDNFAKEIKKINNTKQATNAYFGKSALFQGSYYIDSKK